MRGLRAHASVGLLLLLTCTLVGAAPTSRASVGQGSRRATEPAMRVEELGRGAESTTMTKTRAAEARRSRWSGAVTVNPRGQHRDLRRSKADRRDRPVAAAAAAAAASAAAAAAASPGRKDKYLKHITGPLYFSPKCRKHVYHVYHQTRDCTIAAYFKRCARLLTRLAGSPMCTGV